MLKKVAVLTALALALCVIPAFAQDGHAAGRDPGTTGSSTHLGFALGIGLAIAAFGGAFGQSRAIAAAVEAVARQPEAGGRIQGMMIIGLALIETLVIYMLLICFMWGGKVV